MAGGEQLTRAFVFQTRDQKRCVWEINDRELCVPVFAPPFVIGSTSKYFLRANRCCTSQD